jgi:hypothetical protein
MGRARYQVHSGRLGQHLVGKFHAALGLVKGKVAGNGISDKVGGADLVLGVLQHKTYESNRTILHGIQGLLRGGFGFLLSRVVLRFGQIFSSRVFGRRRLVYKRVGVKVKEKEVAQVADGSWPEQSKAIPDNKYLYTHRPKKRGLPKKHEADSEAYGKQLGKPDEEELVETGTGVLEAAQWCGMVSQALELRNGFSEFPQKW